MDFYTANTAHTLHVQDALRAEQERNRRRIAKERAAEIAAGRTEARPLPRARRASVILAMFRGRTHTAQ